MLPGERYLFVLQLLPKYALLRLQLQLIQIFDGSEPAAVGALRRAAVAKFAFEFRLLRGVPFKLVRLLRVEFLFAFIEFAVGARQFPECSGRFVDEDLPQFGGVAAIDLFALLSDLAGFFVWFTHGIGLLEFPMRVGGVEIGKCASVLILGMKSFRKCVSRLSLALSG